MKMKLNELIMLNQILKNLIDNDKELQINTLFKFKVLGILKILENPIANFEVIRNEKIKEYGTEDENGTISIPQDDESIMKKFSDDLNKLLETEVDVPIEKLKIDDVFRAGIPADYLVGLYGIMEE